MYTTFGIVSTRLTQSDALGRSRPCLVMRRVGPSGDDDAGIRYDVEDLAILAALPGSAIPEMALGHWQAPLAQALLPWAVVHASVEAPVVASLHGDGLCTIANAPGGRGLCADALGGEVSWLTGGCPGPGLARALGALDGATAMGPHVGVIAWGDTAPDVLGRVERLESTAVAWLRAVSVDLAALGGRSTTEGQLPVETEGALVGLRGRLSAAGHRIVHVDGSIDAIARRADAERIAAAASVLEPGESGLIASASSAVPSDAPAATVLLVPGLGSLSAGRDEPSARRRGMVAAHALRVTTAIIDGLGEAPESRADKAPTIAGSGEEAPAPTPPAAGRAYIITGAASGIGRDIARHLASLGAQLAIADISAEGLELVADEIAGPQGRPVTVTGDLTDEHVADRLVAETVRCFGGVDGAVLNVGIALPGELRSLSLADWRRSLEVNTTAHFLLVRRLLPILEAQGMGGSLVFIGSKNMFSPGAGFGAYSASKAALAQLARLVAIEAGPYGVRSNIVNPDNVFEGSALWSPELRAQRAAVYGIKAEDLEAYYTQRNLMKVPITGMDVARAVAFLLSDDAARTTACVVTVDGGVPGVFPR